MHIVAVASLLGLASFTAALPATTPTTFSTRVSLHSHHGSHTHRPTNAPAFLTEDRDETFAKRQELWGRKKCQADCKAKYLDVFCQDGDVCLKNYDKCMKDCDKIPEFCQDVDSCKDAKSLDEGAADTAAAPIEKRQTDLEKCKSECQTSFGGDCGMDWVCDVLLNTCLSVCEDHSNGAPPATVERRQKVDLRNQDALCHDAYSKCLEDGGSRGVCVTSLATCKHQSNISSVIKRQSKQDQRFDCFEGCKKDHTECRKKDYHIGPCLSTFNKCQTECVKAHPWADDFTFNVQALTTDPGAPPAEPLPKESDFLITTREVPKPKDKRQDPPPSTPIREACYDHCKVTYYACINGATDFHYCADWRNACVNSCNEGVTVEGPATPPVNAIPPLSKRRANFECTDFTTPEAVACCNTCDKTWDQCYAGGFSEATCNVNFNICMSRCPLTPLPPAAKDDGNAAAIAKRQTAEQIATWSPHKQCMYNCRKNFDQCIDNGAGEAYCFEFTKTCESGCEHLPSYPSESGFEGPELPPSEAVSSALERRQNTQAQVDECEKSCVFKNWICLADPTQTESICAMGYKFCRSYCLNLDIDPPKTQKRAVEEPIEKRQVTSEQVDNCLRDCVFENWVCLADPATQDTTKCQLSYNLCRNVCAHLQDIINVGQPPAAKKAVEERQEGPWPYACEDWCIAEVKKCEKSVLSDAECDKQFRFCLTVCPALDDIMNLAIEHGYQPPKRSMSESSAEQESIASVDIEKRQVMYMAPDNFGDTPKGKCRRHCNDKMNWCSASIPFPGTPGRDCRGEDAGCQKVCDSLDEIVDLGDGKDKRQIEVISAETLQCRRTCNNDLDVCLAGQHDPAYCNNTYDLYWKTCPPGHIEPTNPSSVSSRVVWEIMNISSKGT